MRDIEKYIDDVVENVQDQIVESQIIQNAGRRLAEAHKSLKRRPRYRKLAQLAVRLDSFMGEDAFVESNRRAAQQKRLERERLEEVERQRQWEEEYNKPENVERRRRESEAWVSKKIADRKAYAEGIKARSGFNFKEWLQRYDTKADHVTVELGHGSRPLARYHHFTGKRMYIGVEANINTEFGANGNTDKVRKEIKTKRPGENISFIDIETGFDRGRYDLTGNDQNISGRMQSILQEGQKYNPASILPDGAADVVFMSHVLYDPRINTARRIELLKEAARITAPGGKLVISEYDNDWYTLPGSYLEEAGLQMDQIMFWQDDHEEFDQMQQRFHIFEDPEFVMEKSVFGFGGFGLANLYKSSDRYRLEEGGDLSAPDNAFYMILSKSPEA